MKTLAEFLRLNRDAILGEWTREASSLPSSRRRPRPTIRDQVPQVIDELAQAVDDEGDGRAESAAAHHAHERFADGYDVRDVVHEYGILRRTILERYRTADDGIRPELRARLAPIIHLDEVLDASVGDAVDQFVAERDREHDVLNGILSHDLRAPLQSILIGAELIAREHAARDPALVARSARRIHGAALRMNGMISDLMDFTRAQLGGGLPISRAPIDLRTVIADAVAEVSVAHPERRIDDRASSSYVDLRGNFGPVRLAQALVNLLTNAVVHGQDPIVIDAVPDGDAVRIEVANRGEIAAAQLPTLFQPFTGLVERDATHRGPAGLGLGLYIVSEIARAHGGRVDATSAGGETRVRMWLPR